MSFITYAKESFDELNNKMTWESREEAQKTTVVVAAFTIVFALAVFIVDKVFQGALDNFFRLFV